MSEEKPSETIEFFIITFGIIVIFLFSAKPLIDLIASFVYFFSKANSEYISDTISELITVSAGTPGNVNIKFIKPSGYDYDIYFKGKMVYVETYNYKKPIGISNEELEKIGNKSYSSSPVNFEHKNFLNFQIIEIEKNQKIKIGGI